MEALTNPPRRPLLAATSLLCLVIAGTAFVLMTRSDQATPAPSTAPSTTTATTAPSSSAPQGSVPNPPAPLRLAAGVKVAPAPATAYTLEPLTAVERERIAAAFGTTGLLEKDGAYRAAGLTIWPSGQWSYAAASMTSSSPSTTQPSASMITMDTAAARRETERLVKALGLKAARISVVELPGRVVVNVAAEHDGELLLPSSAFVFTDELVSAAGVLPRTGSASPFAPKTLTEVLDTTGVTTLFVSSTRENATAERGEITTATPAWIAETDTESARLIPGWVLTTSDGGTWAVAADPAYRPFVPPAPAR